MAFLPIRTKPVDVDYSRMGGGGGGFGLQDKLLAAARILGGEEGVLEKMQLLRAAQDQQRERGRLEEEFNSSMRGEPGRIERVDPEPAPEPAQTARGDAVGHTAANILKSLSGGADVPLRADKVDTSVPQYNVTKGAPATRQSLMPILARMEAAGIPIRDKLALIEASQPNRRYMQATDGIYELDEDTGQTKLVHSFPQKHSVSPGWEEDGEGGWRPVKNGPYDPDYIAKAAGTRRDQIVSRPIPRKGGGGRSGGGVPPPPPGWVMEK